MSKIIECVPNFSEGRNKAVLEAIAKAISSVENVSLLDVDPGYDTNRTVYTFVGEPESVIKASVEAAKVAYHLIDMTKHSGAHPRMGAMDVCPFIPVKDVSMEECVIYAKKAAKMISATLCVPIYLYEYAASNENRRSLANIRSGEYEGLVEKLKDPEWKPDYGKADFVPSWGASVVGAREFLVAYNVNLNTRDKKLANNVAFAVRESGRAKRDKDGNIIKGPDGKNEMIPGRLKNVRAIGWYIDEYKMAQVSINLTNYKETSLYSVYETVKEEAEKIGLCVCGSELVGLIPLEPLVETGRYYLKKSGKSMGCPINEVLDIAIKTLGLNSVSSFDPEKKIIEYASKKTSKLIKLKTETFVDEVSSESVAPGGGSVSALAGSLAAALSAMVANLTVGKKNYENVWDELSNLAVKAQELKDKLLIHVDEDTNAFNSVIEAMKLPKKTESEIQIRELELQKAYKKAIEVPFATSVMCLEACKLSKLALKGNKASSSDIGVAALLARAGTEGAILNVLINLGSVKDEVYVKDMKEKIAQMKAESEKICMEVQNEVENMIK